MAIKLVPVASLNISAPYCIAVINNNGFLTDVNGYIRAINLDTMQLTNSIVCEAPFMIERIGNNLAVTTNSGINFYNTNLTQLSQVTVEGAYCIKAIDSRYLACASFENTFYIYDLNNIYNPVLVGSLSDTDFGEIHDIAIDGNTAYITSFDKNKIHYINIEDKSDPTLIDNITVSYPHYLTKDTNNLYVSCYNSLCIQVIDLTTKEIIETVTNIPYPNSLLNYGDYLLACSHQNGIYVIKKSNFKITNVFCLQTGIHYIVNDGKHIYVLEYSQNGVLKLYPEITGEDHALVVNMLIRSISKISCYKKQTIRPKVKIELQTNSYAEYDYTPYNYDKMFTLPSVQPIFKVIMYKDNEPINITPFIVNVSDLIWQTEQDYEINQFYASNINIKVLNDKIFDNIKKNTMFRIYIGYIIDGKESFKLFFTGYMINLEYNFDGTLEFDIACLYSLLKQLKIDDIAETRHEKAYGGDLVAYVVKQNFFPDRSSNLYVSDDAKDFPDSGYIEIKQTSTVLYYSKKDYDINLQTYVFRNIRIITTGITNLDKNGVAPIGAKIYLLLDNLESTEGVKFQIPFYPCVVTDIQTSDGNITILPSKSDFLTLRKQERKLYATVDTEKGIIEFGDIISDSNSVFVTYKVFPTGFTYKAFLEHVCDKLKINYDVEDVEFNDYLNRNIAINMGHAIYGIKNNKIVKISHYICKALDVDNDGTIYLGIADQLIKYTDKYEIITSVAGNNIVQIKVLDNGDVMFVGQPPEINKNCILYRYNAQTQNTTVISDELHYYDFQHPYYTAERRWCQWYSFDADDNYLYALYKTGTDTNIQIGILKVDLNDNTVVKYPIPNFYNDWTKQTYKFVNFAVTSNSIGVFCLVNNRYTVGYYELSKSNWQYSYIGSISFTGILSNKILQNLYGIHISDVCFHQQESRYYLNFLFITPTITLPKYGILASINKDSTNITRILDYFCKDTKIFPDGKISGMVYYDGAIYAIKGAEYAIGDGDGADGYIYKIYQNNIEDYAQGAIKSKKVRQEKEITERYYKGVACRLVYKDKLYFISSDIDTTNRKIAYSISYVSNKFKPVIKNETLYSRSVMDVIKDMAIISGYNFTTDRTGALIFKSRTPNIYTKLSQALTYNANRIYVDSTAKFPSSGLLQIDVEIISYLSKDETSFMGCTRGLYGSVPVNHYIGSEVYCIDKAIMNAYNYKTLIDCNVRTNYEEIYQNVKVICGDKEISINQNILNENLDDVSMNDELVIQPNLLTEDDIYLAQNIAYRYYQTYKEHHPLYDLTITLNPDININDIISIYYNEQFRNKIDYAKARIRKIILDMRNYIIRITGIGNIKFYKNHEY